MPIHDNPNDAVRKPGRPSNERHSMTKAQLIFLAVVILAALSATLIPHPIHSY